MMPIVATHRPDTRCAEAPIWVMGGPTSSLALRPRSSRGYRGMWPGTCGVTFRLGSMLAHGVLFFSMSCRGLAAGDEARSASAHRPAGLLQVAAGGAGQRDAAERRPTSLLQPVAFIDHGSVVLVVAWLRDASGALVDQVRTPQTGVRPRSSSSQQHQSPRIRVQPCLRCHQAAKACDAVSAWR